jgi:hypothetical protein
LRRRLRAGFLAALDFFATFRRARRFGAAFFAVFRLAVFFLAVFFADFRAVVLRRFGAAFLADFLAAETRFFGARFFAVPVFFAARRFFGGMRCHPLSILRRKA